MLCSRNLLARNFRQLKTRSYGTQPKAQASCAPAGYARLGRPLVRVTNELFEQELWKHGPSVKLLQDACALPRRGEVPTGAQDATAKRQGLCAQAPVVCAQHHLLRG